MGKKSQIAGIKKPVLVNLNQEEYDRLTTLCKARKQSRADFLRAAIQVPDAIPIIDTRTLQGACLQRHLARVAREKKTKRRAGKE